MVIVILLFLIVLKLEAAQLHHMTFSTVIIQGPGGEDCLSKHQRENALLMIRNNITSIIGNATIIPECGDGLWYPVAYLNMTDPTQQCPSAWRLYNTSGVRACGRPVTSRQSCPATFYPTGHQYSKVCGRVIAYQYSSPGAFHIVYISPRPMSLDDTYVNGVSITHGNPRSHIWTFAAGETEGNYIYGPGPDCPCSRTGATKAPNFIGNNYYCESGNPTNYSISNRLHTNDPLWDGQQCEGQCCTNGKSPPWFSVELNHTTTDDIEVRICEDENTNNEDTPIQMMEIYVS